eukprot:gene10850-12065_t
MSLQPKDQVQRSIDGIWFDAVVEKVHRQRQTVSIRYLDDENYESDVPFEEIRTITDEENRRYNNSNSSSGRQQQQGVVDTLPRPLAGLVDDDHEVRKRHIPTVFIHSDSSLDEAIILNGAENKLAAGGGLRALRYLKPSS